MFALSMAFLMALLLSNIVFSDEEMRLPRYYLSTSNFNSQWIEQPIRCSFEWEYVIQKYLTNCECQANNGWEMCDDYKPYKGLFLHIKQTREDEEACGLHQCFHIELIAPMKECATSMQISGDFTTDICAPDDLAQQWSFKKVDPDKHLKDACFLQSDPCIVEDYEDDESEEGDKKSTVPISSSSVYMTSTTLIESINSTMWTNSSPTSSSKLLSSIPVQNFTGIRLSSSFVTFEACANDQCLWQLDGLPLPNECFTEYVLYSGTRIPCSPMSRNMQVAAKVLNTFGSMWVSGTTITSAIFTLLSKSKLLLHHIQFAQDILLGLSHLLIMLIVSRTDSEVLCETTAISLTVSLVLQIILIMLECILVYSLLTNTHNSWHSLCLKLITGSITAGFTCAMLPYLIWYRHLMPSSFSCWINYDNHIAKTVLVSTSIFFSLSMIFAEAGISGMHNPLPSVATAERNLAKISATTLVLKITLSKASMVLTSFSMYYQRFSLFPVAFGVNVALGWTVFLAHTAGNSMVNTLLRKAHEFVKTCVNRRSRQISEY